MRVFSDFRLFERPPESIGVALFRWLAWRCLLLGVLFTGFVAVLALITYVGGESIYYVNEHRNLSDDETSGLLMLFLGSGGLMLLLGLAGVLIVPKA